MAAGFVSAQRPKGDVLRFRRSSRRRKAHERELEEMHLPVTPTHIRHSTEPERVTYSHDLALRIESQKSILTWSGLTYDIKVAGKVRRLLDEVDGWVKPGTLTALMVRLESGK